MESALTRLLQPQIEALRVLLVDDDQYMRKVVRAMLAAIGVKTVFEANDGITGLESIRQNNPDLVIVDWEMPMIDGAQFVRLVRSPGDFPVPDIPIIMLSGHGDRWRVVEAARIGAHEYLLKPVSTKSLLDRIVAIIGKPRPIVKMEGYYGPAPRRLVVLEADTEAEAAVRRKAAASKLAEPNAAEPKAAAPPSPQLRLLDPRPATSQSGKRKPFGRRTPPDGFVLVN